MSLSQVGPVIWDATGSRNGTGCFNIPTTIIVGEPLVFQYFVTCDVNALSFMSDDAHSADNGGGGISFAVWINTDMNPGGVLNTWAGLFGVGKDGDEVVEVHCPSHTPAGNTMTPTDFIFYASKPPSEQTYLQANLPLIDYGGRWNHFAFVKEPSRVTIYCNGNVAAQWEQGELHPFVYGQLFPPPADRFRIATRVNGDNWGMWAGKMNDFQVYDYALSAEEFEWLATDGGTFVDPLVSKANIKKDGTTADQIVNFGDLAIMGQQWGVPPILWP